MSKGPGQPGTQTKIRAGDSAALWAELTARRWIARRPGTRAVIVTRAGTRGLKRTLGITVE